jgi:hypothetical protein
VLDGVIEELRNGIKDLRWLVGWGLCYFEVKFEIFEDFEVIIEILRLVGAMHMFLVYITTQDT